MLPSRATSPGSILPTILSRPGTSTSFRVRLILGVLVALGTVVWIILTVQSPAWCATTASPQLQTQTPQEQTISPARSIRTFDEQPQPCKDTFFGAPTASTLLTKQQFQNHRDADVEAYEPWKCAATILGSITNLLHGLKQLDGAPVQVHSTQSASDAPKQWQPFLQSLDAQAQAKTTAKFTLHASNNLDTSTTVPFPIGLMLHRGATTPALLSSGLVRKFPVMIVYGTRLYVNEYMEWMDSYGNHRVFPNGELIVLLLWTDEIATISGFIDAVDSAMNTLHCERGRTYVSIAVNDVVTYSFYAPIVAAVWLHQTGWYTHVNQIGEEWATVHASPSTLPESNNHDPSVPFELAFSRRVGQELTRHSSSGFVSLYQSGSTGPYDTIPVAQLSRTYTSMHPKFYEQDFILTADSDILPTHPKYFVEPLVKDPPVAATSAEKGAGIGRKVHIYQSGCCGTFKFNERSVDNYNSAREIQRFAMSYIGAHVTVWRSMISSSFHMQHGRQSILSVTTHALDLETDEYFSRREERHIESYAKPGQKHYVNRDGRFWELDELITSRTLQSWIGWPDSFAHTGRPPSRVDKGDFHSGRAGQMPLIGDSHLIGPGFSRPQWKEVRLLIQRLLPTKEFQRVDEYAKEIQEIYDAYHP